MNPLSWISGLFNAIAGFFGWMKGRNDLKNTPEMKKAETAQKKNDERDRVHRDIKEGNEESIRNDLS